MNIKIKSLPELGISMLLAFLTILLLFPSCSIHWRIPERVDVTKVHELSPKAVVDLYWRASLAGDTDAIRKLTGSPGDSMLWECPPLKRGATLPKIFPQPSHQRDGFTDEVSGRVNPPDNTETMLLQSRVITINPTFYADRYELAEEKTSGRESRIILRPKEDPVPSRTYVFFLLHNGERWTLVDISFADLLHHVGNKRFGEQRDCPNSRDNGAKQPQMEKPNIGQ